MLSFPTSMRVLAVVALAVVLSVVGAVGVIALDIDVLASDPDADALVDEVLETHGDVETIQATRHSSYELYHTRDDGPTTGETTAEVWKRFPDQSRTEVTSSTAPEFDVGDVRVVDGTTFKQYDARAESMLVDDDWDGEAIDWGADTHDVDLEAAYLGTETVDDREAHVVEIEPADDETADGISLLVGDTEFALEVGADEDANATRTTTWWIDADAGFPIKERIESEYENPDEHVFQREREVRTVTYENATFDDPIDDDRFVVDPPAGTDVYEPSDSVDVDTLAEANEAVPFDVQKPPVPDRFERVIVSASEFQGDVSVDALYRDGELEDGDEIYVHVSDAPFDRGEIKEQSVGDHGGDVVSTAVGTGYTWECDGIYYELVVDDDQRDDDAFAIELAEGIACS
ncbi:Outer membrane lipoprotein-sorting protein [Natrarchaeobaculum sulfurireducens]|uniref:Outer membrane lipoprotein-sorting protein n=2 Tax=Natrarchaeobaculum sulfurireducens TaxID=2044521 RepID=A0A346PBQ5_9EURY|nr:Outer membrane lipoprotein-sorting protein [Natrarchaeobaculum sulfurireducens]